MSKNTKKYSTFILEAFSFFKKTPKDPFSPGNRDSENPDPIDPKWISIIKKHVNCAKLGYSSKLQTQMGNGLHCKGGNYTFYFFQLYGNLYAKAGYHRNDSLGRKKSIGTLETKHVIKTEQDLIDLLKKAKL